MFCQRVTHLFFFSNNAVYFQHKDQWDPPTAGFCGFSTALFLILEVRHYRVATNPRSGLLRSARLAASTPDRISNHRLTSPINRVDEPGKPQMSGQ